MTTDARYARQVALFGVEGQRRIRATTAAIIGLGGLGAHVTQQLAYLGVPRFSLVDGDTIAESNLNRLIGARPSDVGMPTADIAARVVGAVEPDATIERGSSHFSRESSLPGGGVPDVLFGCVDDDAARLELVWYASTHGVPYIDLASDVSAAGEFGGRVVFAKDGERCLSCLGELDQHVIARAQMTPEQQAADDAIYGIARDDLEDSGPSVVAINGVVASLAVTEFMVWRTGIRPPAGYLNYRGDLGTVGRRSDPDRPYCHYCMALWPEAVRQRT
jgi:molybdopterin-synthase adenylyltransferase